MKLPDFICVGAQKAGTTTLHDILKRIFSRSFRAKAYEDLSFFDAIAVEKERIKKDQFSRNHFSYISRGLYYEQVKRYFDLFGEENVKVYLFEEDFINNKKAMIKDILQFLNVTQVELNLNIKSNKASKVKNKTLNNFLTKKSILKTLIGKLIPSYTTKQKIRDKLNILNQKEFVYDKLTKEEKNKIVNIYFKDDISSTSKLIKRDLTCWRHDAEK